MLFYLFSTGQAALAATSPDILAVVDQVESEQANNKPVPEDAVERELEANEDPLSAQTTDLHEKTGHWYREHTSLKPYGSARYRYGISDGENGFDDAGSRAGLKGELQFQPRFWLLGRVELGFKLFDTLDQVIKASGRLHDEDVDISTRLAYAGLSTPSTTLTIGKNWSSYYQVTGLTDRFEDFGGEASGTYNALTDGGATGTGRADEVLQGRFSVGDFAKTLNLKPFKLNLQLQPGQEIPQTDGADYEYAFGLSALLETQAGGFLGIAYNRAFITNGDEAALTNYGIDGDAQALALGTRRFGDDYYLATTVSLLENHETTDEGIYFDGWGWEVFASYRMAPRWWVVGGWNALTPHGDQHQARDYQLRYGVVGLRYTFDEFRRMLYSEIRLDNSHQADGTPMGNVYSLGIRWDLP